MTIRRPGRSIRGIRVFGVDVDAETRCAHYASDRDVIAIKFACCDDYYPCLSCHDELTDHQPAVWKATEFDEPAVLCGQCGSELTITTYLDASSTCPHCEAAFNPGCRTHWPHYFDVEQSD